MIRLGYACINTGIGCTSNSTFRLASYSEGRLIETVQKNLNCLKKILQWNKQQDILFFRIGSQIVPFASHPVCKYNWQNHFKNQFRLIGSFIKSNKIRITMHPDQFVVLNSKNKSIVEKSVKELKYHCDVLDLMKLGAEAKIVVHVGGVYNEKKKSMDRFVLNYKRLPTKIKKRLVIENDDKSYSLNDCLDISKQIKVPVIFDVFHHECLNNNELVQDAILLARKTWTKKDGRQIIHYSNQKKNSRKGSHSQSIDLQKFGKFLRKTKKIELDIMLEVKNKEQSVLTSKKLLETGKKTK